MDQLNSKNLSVLSLSLFIITYLSAFKNGKPTCDRYLVNNFLYLLTIICVYVTSITTLDEKNIEVKSSISLMLGLLSLALIFAYTGTKNTLLKHIIWLVIILSLSYISKRFYDKYDKKQIKKVIVKLMVILLICVIIALSFPQLIKPKLEIALLFAAVILIIMRVIDFFFLDREYGNLISTLIIFVFSGFMIYDTGRVMKLKKLCSESIPADYLMNTSNLFLDILSIFENLLFIED
jgi:FtsH-binding integral membrane protein